MPKSTSKKCRTPQDIASFYLSYINEKNGRKWWQTMQREKMKTICVELLAEPKKLLAVTQVEIANLLTILDR